MSRVLLTGLGAVGSYAVRQLVDTRGIESVMVADRRAERARSVAAAVGGRVEAGSWRPGDAIPPGVDVVASAVPWAVDPTVLAAAIDAGVAAVSCADDVYALGGAVALDGAAVDAGVRVLVGCGLAPGLSDVLARHAADALDTVDEVSIARTGAAGSASRTALHRSLRDQAEEFRDGVLRPLRRRGGPSLEWFPDPIGAVECHQIASGVSLLGSGFPGIERVSVRASAGAPERGRWSRLRRSDPLETWGAVRVEVWGTRGRARETIVYGAIERTAVAAGTVLAVATAALAGALPDVVDASPGVHGLAETVRPVPFLAELAARGVKAAVFEGVAVS